MRDSLGISRKAKFMQVDTNRENLYNLCKDNLLTQKEISEIMQLSLYKIKAYVNELLKNKHLERHEVGAFANNHLIVKFKSTETVYKPRTPEEVDECIRLRQNAPKECKKGIYDDLIASNPNLRKISLFDDKNRPTSDFSYSGQKGKVNRSVSSSWGMYDSF